MNRELEVKVSGDFGPFFFLSLERLVGFFIASWLLVPKPLSHSPRSTTILFLPLH